MGQLDDKVALITGAGRGIGRAVALTFANEGSRVAATGRREDRLTQLAAEIHSCGGTAKAYRLDVTSVGDANRVARQVVADWGRIDILVNNAGVITYDTPVWATSVDQWDYVMDTNLRGMFLVSRAVIPHMLQGQEGVIINIGSSSARRPEGDYGAYATSKWGVAGYTASLAHSLRSHGIRVNGINPDWVDTDLAREHDPDGNPAWITTEQIAQAALYLAAHAPKVMTGQFIDIFGA